MRQIYGKAPGFPQGASGGLVIPIALAPAAHVELGLAGLQCFAVVLVALVAVVRGASLMARASSEEEG